jgi:hypothetical protein
MYNKTILLDDEPQRFREAPPYAQEESPLANKRSRRGRWLAKFVLPVMLLCCLATEVGALSDDYKYAPFAKENVQITWESDSRRFKFVIGVAKWRTDRWYHWFDMQVNNSITLFKFTHNNHSGGDEWIQYQRNSILSDGENGYVAMGYSKYSDYVNNLYTYYDNDDGSNDSHVYITMYWYPSTKYADQEVSFDLYAVDEDKSSKNIIHNDTKFYVTATNPAGKPSVKNVTYTSNGYVNIDGDFPNSSTTVRGVEYTELNSARQGLTTTSSNNNTTFSYNYPVNPELVKRGWDIYLYNTWNLESYQRMDYKKYSDKYTILPIQIPEIIDAKLEGETQWKLRWSVNNTIQEHTQAKEVVVKLYAGIPGAVVQIGDSMVVAYDKGEALFNIPESYIGIGAVYFKFDLYRRPFVNAYHRTFETASINMAYRQASIETITSRGGSGFTITWKNIAGYFLNSYKYRLKISQGEKSIYQNDIDITKTTLDYTLPSGSGFDMCDDETIVLEVLDGDGNVLTTSDESYYNFSIGDATSKIESLSVSKGFYTDMVRLSWTVSKTNTFARYSIIRKEYTDNANNGYKATDVEVLAGTVSHETSRNSYTFEDKFIQPGVLYTYTVAGEKDCGSKMSVADFISDEGYIQPYGTVSGRVSYAAGTAVQGVTVSATGSKKLANKALVLSDTYLWLPNNGNRFNPEKFSFQAWVKFNGELDSIAKNQPLLSSNSYDCNIVFGNNGELLLGYKDKSGNNASSRSGIQIPNNEYHHITITFDSNAENSEIAFYLDGVLKKKETNVLSTQGSNEGYYLGYAPLYIGTMRTNGYIDEVRLWTKALTASEIEGNYNAYISGKEEGLSHYYRFDEAETLGRVFDLSAHNNKFNENHGLIYGKIQRSSADGEIPTITQLAIKAVTDNNGYYLLNTIPYSADGDAFIIRPDFGIHTFNPNNRQLTFQPGGSQFTADFEDISSFPVSGKITYHNSNYPVEGVLFAIDGVIVAKDGKMVESRADGTFTVDVPIGNHFITVSKEGHTFADGGRFPPNELIKYNFQNEETGIDFSDLTTVRLAGRVAGGDPQTEKPIGFGLSNANIGKATITLKTTNNFRLNLTAENFVYQDSIPDNLKQSDPNYQDLIISKIKFLGSGDGNEIEIETDPLTGEFIADIPPVPYNITRIKTKEFEYSAVDGGRKDFSFNKNYFDINPSASQELKYTDAEKKVHSLTVHDSLKITRYNEPTIAVRDLGAADGAFGDSVYIYRNTLLDIEDTIRLYNVQPDGTIDYTFGYPFFSQKEHTYKWEVSTYEEYTNNDDESNPQTETVPLAGKIIEINNGLASGYTEITDAGEQIALTASESEIELDDEGKKTFSFNTGFPKMGGDYLLETKLTLNQNGNNIVWNNNQSSGTFKAYLMGQVPTDGNNFVTQGPDKIDIVLPDPPGSYSYAYIEKGSSITSSHEKTYTFETSEVGALTIHVGPKHDIGFGIGSWTENELEVIGDFTGTAGGKQTKGKGNRIEKTTTFNERIATSGDISFVGSDADVYIGTSTNLIFGQVRQLSFYPNAEDSNPNNQLVTADKQYSLFPKEIIAVGDNFSTMFTYTQDYLLNTQIPNIKNIRNSLIQHWQETTLPSNNSGLTFTDNDGKPLNVIYLSTLAVTDPLFGESGTYQAYYPNNATKANKLIDEVASYNNWIANWKKSIANNEEAKIGLFDKRTELETSKMMFNRSFNAGANIAESITTEYINVSLHDTTKVVLGEFSETGGVRIAGMGFEENVTVGRENTWDDNWEEGNSSSITFGYELSEDGGDYLKGVYDALTVDIFKPVADEMKAIVDGGKQNSPVKTLRGYTFRTRAGQTSCPYEPADSTLFYEKDGKKLLLNYGTFQIEKPDLYINNSKAATAENIPTGREATFEIQMNNMSDTKSAVTYQLSVGDYSNLNGLVLSIDGTPLTSPREYTIEYGEGKELKKTLKVSQSSVDILHYDHIELVMSSTCDDSELTSSSATITIDFTPSSSPITLRSDTKLANIAGLESGRKDGKDGGKINFTISEYERNFENFAEIRLQYRSATSENWNTIRTYINNVALYGSSLVLDETTRLIDNEAQNGTISYEYIYKEIEPSDGEYIFRAVSVSKIGYDDITFSSEEIKVVKDTKKPQLMGFASPTNGILNAGDEISITFNEDLQTGKLVAETNFSITGIPNADIRQEPTVGLAFTGTDVVNTELPIYANGSFSIEGWIKWPEIKAGTIFAYGEGSDFISLGLDEESHAVVTIGSEEKTSTLTLQNSDVWKYIGLSYNRDNNTVSVFAFQETQTMTLINTHSFTQTPATRGKLYVGNTIAGTNGFTGAVAQLHFYDATQSVADMSVSKSVTKSGTEPHLIGLWEMEEAEGTIAADKARARNLKLNNTSWYLYPQGKSIALNGTNQYVTVPGGTFPFFSYDDFTWELWFNGDNQAAATLLSVGTSASIGLDAAHRLILTVGANMQVLTANNLLDNKWHHLALSVNRIGTTTALIDGTVTASFNSTIFGEIKGEYYLGARYNGQYATPQYDNYFIGNVDELRVWASVLTNDAIRLNKNSKLRGNEVGLLAYYPFEQYNKMNGSAYSVDQTLDDFVTPNSIIKDALAATLEGATYSDISTPMKDSRPVKDIPFTITASERKIVLNLSAQAHLIEGITLSITANNIQDMNNNVSNVISWTAYVNRNPLRWEDSDPINLTKNGGESQTFKAKIVNNGGTSTNYIIENLPAWLTVNSSTGTLQPLASKELTFTVNPAINTGAYETAIGLTSGNGVTDILPVVLKVTAQKPDWSVNPADYESSMSVTGQVQISDIYQEDEDDILAAFNGEVCVGVVSPKYITELNAYLTFMTVYGNASDEGDAIIFKLWDAGTGRIYPNVEFKWANGAAQTPIFTPMETYGLPDAPIIHNALDVIEQTIAIKQGWNQISVNVVNNNPTLFNQFKTIAGNAPGNVLKGRNVYTQTSETTGWAGALTAITNTDGYKFKSTRDMALTLIGKPVDVINTQITLATGWNWIGYTPQFSLSVKDALAGLNPQTADQIKGHDGYSQYTVAGWLGSLTNMHPGAGFMYYSKNTANQTLIYPSISPIQMRSSAINADKVAKKWKVNTQSYGENMTVTSVVLDNNTELHSDLIEVAAFSGEECRGSILLENFGDALTHPYLGFLMIYGGANDPITFRIYDHENGKEYKATNAAISFSADGMLGDPLKPYEIVMGSITGIESVNQINVYPNPVSDVLWISRPYDKIDVLEIVELSGRILVREFNFSKESINVSQLKTGMYLLKLSKDGQRFVYKVTKK